MDIKAACACYFIQFLCTFSNVALPWLLRQAVMEEALLPSVLWFCEQAAPQRLSATSAALMFCTVLTSAGFFFPPPFVNRLFAFIFLLSPTDTRLFCASRRVSGDVSVCHLFSCFFCVTCRRKPT